MSSSPTPDFGARAAAYDERHPPRGLDDELVRLGDLAGRRVLDVGCGTGRFVAALVQGFGCEACGVGPEPRMLAVAARRGGERAHFTAGSAERLPFPGGAFERVTMVHVAHLIDRPRSFSECARVVEPGGRLVLASFDPSAFGRYWLNEFFPSMLTADLVRFPTEAQLEGELREVGFVEAHLSRLAAPRELTREEALERIRSRVSATFDLVPGEEYRAGLEKAEHELGARVTDGYEMLLAVAST